MLEEVAGASIFTPLDQLIDNVDNMDEAMRRAVDTIATGVTLFWRMLEKPGYIKAMWCGDLECEMKLKEEADVTSRCIPFGVKPIGDKCVCCGREAKKLVYWGKAY